MNSTNNKALSARDAIGSDAGLADAVASPAAAADKILRDAGLRIAEEPEPIRLAGKRMLSIDVAQAGRIMNMEPSFSRHVDWKTLATMLALTVPETRVFLAHWGRGIPVSRLPGYLKITGHRAMLLYDAVKKKLGINQHAITGCMTIEPVSDSLRPAYRDRLMSGARVWSLGRLDESFRDVMRHETYFSLISQRDPREFQKSRVFCARSIGARMENLQEQLTIEQAKLTRITERSRVAATHEERIAAAANKCELELRDERAQAIMEDREPRLATIEKKLADVQAKLASCKAERTGAAEAQRRQREVIESIESRIQEGRHAAVVAKVKPMASRLTALLDEAAILAKDIEFELVTNVQANEIFTTGEHPETIRERHFMIYTLTRFLNSLTTYNPRLRGELYRKYPGRMPETWERDAA